MIHHLLKIIWKQRRQNTWLATELFLIFILLWYILDYFFTLGYTASTDNGYDISDTYLISLSTIPTSSPYYSANNENKKPADHFFSMLDHIRRYPNVENVCISRSSIPYTSNTSVSYINRDTTIKELVRTQTVNSEFFSVFRISPEEGGSYKQLSNSLNDRKDIIISPLLKNKLFKEKPAIGHTEYDSENSYIYYKITGVTKPQKRHDFDREESTAFYLLTNQKLSKMNEKELAGLEISIRVKPGLNQDNFMLSFKQDMSELLSPGNFILAGITPLDQVRTNLFITLGITDNIRYRIAIIIFFLFNIFLGIIGTFWFRNEYRKPEIGLRMALGATRRKISGMMIGEGWLILTIITIPATIVCFNLAKADLIDTKIMDITIFRISVSLVATYLLMALVILLGAWYPARIASLIAPADTLKTE